MTKENFWKPVAIVLIMAAVLVFYFVMPPGTWYLSCPFRAATGWQCPGCGSQRALHELLHLNLREAFRHNALFVVALPTALILFLFKQKIKKDHAFGQKILSHLLWWLAGFALLLFGILRHF